MSETLCTSPPWKLAVAPTRTESVLAYLPKVPDEEKKWIWIRNRNFYSTYSAPQLWRNPWKWLRPRKCDNRSTSSWLDKGLPQPLCPHRRRSGHRLYFAVCRHASRKLEKWRSRRSQWVWRVSSSNVECLMSEDVKILTRLWFFLSLSLSFIGVLIYFNCLTIVRR